VTTVEDPVALREHALEILCSKELSSIVELVCASPQPDTYEARNTGGAVRFRRTNTGSSYDFEIAHVSGSNPLQVRDPARFSPLAQELANPLPDRRSNSYPFAFEHIAQVFDHRCAPDLCVLHTAAHNPEGHRGEHGSLGVVQSRAPMIASGAGILRNGLVDRHCRLVDFAPTVLALLRAGTRIATGPSGSSIEHAFLSRQDGLVIPDLIDQTARVDHVIGFLLDGANPNMVYDMALRGDAPTLAALIAGGTAFNQGAIASFPTVTLPNHTTLMTGCHPGHHGVLHNAWYDRELGRQVITESPATWQESMKWLTPGVETIHEALARAKPGACSFSVNEPADRGATYSTFELFRRGEISALSGIVPKPLPDTTLEFEATSNDYHWGSTVDSSAVAQACALLGGSFDGNNYGAPDFMWVNTSLTDAASHEAGPHSDMAQAAVRDTDARIARVLDAARASIGLDHTAIFVLADHGMELNDPSVTGDWDDALRDAGIPFRDEASGFIYLGVAQ
jgi:hypothetical protein